MIILDEFTNALDKNSSIDGHDGIKYLFGSSIYADY